MAFLVCSLAIMWVAFSGYLAIKFFVMGGVSIALVLWLSRRMGLLHPERVPLYLRLRSVIYWPWLLWEIVKASIEVSGRIWQMSQGNLRVRPVVAKIKGRHKGDVGKALYANSITLTPGTLCVDVVGDDMVVHALTAGGIADLKAGVMDKKVCDFVGEEAE